MSRASGPISLAAERAVRLLRHSETPLTSSDLAFRVLSIKIADEAKAKLILDTAFSGDPRLVCEALQWTLTGEPGDQDRELSPERDKVWLLLEGERKTAGRTFELRRLDVIRIQGNNIVAACGGEPIHGHGGALLRQTVRDTLDGAAPFTHESAGAVTAFEGWLDEPLEGWVDLKQIARDRLGIAARHELPELAAALKIDWCETEDPLERVETLERCLERLRQPEESLEDLFRASWPEAPEIEWANLAFDRESLRTIPHAPGIYKFFDRKGRLLYVGKSRDLHRRLQSYFQPQRQRSPRVTRIISRLYRMEYEITGSELEALLHEARAIMRDQPEVNTQRLIRGRKPYREKLRSILILEPAQRPAVLRAYLIRNGRWIGKVAIGPRGGGLKQIRRLLDRAFFDLEGPHVEIQPAEETAERIDLELVTRWLAANRDRAVTFDPTDLRTSEEVILRLKSFLQYGEPSDPDGLPFLGR
jgi:hypothetical protein